MPVQYLPCGGTITTGEADEGDVMRIVRVLGTGRRRLTFILAHPPRNDEPDTELTLCIRAAKKRDFDICTIVYLFPYRAKEAKELKKFNAPRGNTPWNRRIMECEIRLTDWGGGTVIAAWGDAGSHKNTDLEVIRRFDGSPYGGVREKPIPIMVLGLTPRGAASSPTARNIMNPLQPLFECAARRTAA